MKHSSSARSRTDQAASSGCDAVGGGEGVGGSAASPAAVSSYLEQDGNSVTEPSCGECFEVRSVGCRSWFCPHCCLPLGLALQRRLSRELRRFRGLMMLTFTVDPELFESPQAAFAYVTTKRCVAVAIQRLDRWGLLHSRDFFAVVEWQANGWPHWHVLVNASRVPFERLCEAWNRNWRSWRERVAMGRPGFGSVRFSVPRLGDAGKAASYVTAYLTKVPERGYPQWVRDGETRKVRRFSTSRGFWTETADDDEAEALSETTSDGGDDDGQDEEDEQQQTRRTIEQQLAECGKACVVLRLRVMVDEQTGEVVERREFVKWFPMPLSEVLALRPREVNRRRTVARFELVFPLLRELERRSNRLDGRGDTG
jgi:hypothetical protein